MIRKKSPNLQTQSWLSMSLSLRYAKYIFTPTFHLLKEVKILLKEMRGWWVISYKVKCFSHSVPRAGRGEYVAPRLGWVYVQLPLSLSDKYGFLYCFLMFSDICARGFSTLD